MSERYPGGYITKTAPQPTGGESGTAPGVWTLEQAAEYQKAGNWPSPPPPPYIEDVFSTYLYTGNGTRQSIANGIGLGSSYGGSVFFDGDNDRLTVNTNSVLDLTGDFTIEFWMYPTSLDSYDVIFDTSASGSAGSQMTELWIRSTGAIEYYVQGSILLSGTGVVANSWQHVALVRNGSVQTLYLNGVSVATATSTTTPNTGFNWYIGDRQASAGSGQYPYTGFLSNFRVVKGTAIYTSNFTPPTAPLTAVSGTSLLICQAPNATTNYSSTALTVTVTNAVAQNSGGPFTNSASAKGGLVWIKSRSGGFNNILCDTARGVPYYLVSNATDESRNGASTGYGYVNSFNTTGFSVTGGPSGSQWTNATSSTYVSWTFRQQPKFFDIVTYTGNGVAGRTISHNLASVPGCIIVKGINNVDGWPVYHRSIGATTTILLNGTGAQQGANAAWWNNTAPTSSVFTVGNDGSVNANGGTYVAYLFAHDAGGFGPNLSDNVISCGSFTGGSPATVNLGWEPQWLLIKSSTNADDWYLFDTMRGWTSDYSNLNYLRANTAGAESTNGTTTGLTSTGFNFNYGSGQTFIYIAIRRGPMKTPEAGTEVFSPVTRVGTGANATITAGFPVDFVIASERDKNISTYNTFLDRLRGKTALLTSTLTSGEQALTDTIRDFTNTGINVGPDGYGVINGSPGNYINWMFRRAPGFFDVVCYTGTGANRTVSHNLGVAPELMITKQRSGTSQWNIYHSALGASAFVQFTTAAATTGDSTRWNSTSPTSSVFSLGTSSSLNSSGQTYVWYGFATVAGVSKVGSYTGTGTTQQINCGFTNGARFVLIKRVDTTGDWYVWDSARGIVAGNDPYLLINSASVEVTNTDYVDTYSQGFEISSTAPAAINASGGTFIYLAIA